MVCPRRRRVLFAAKKPMQAGRRRACGIVALDTSTSCGQYPPVHTDSFRWITVVLSMILGLGITRLLSALVAMFKSRGHSRLDVMPLLWAACIFLWQLQFWWAIIELPSLVKTWTILDFLVLVSLTLFLFLAAALVVPHTELRPGESLEDSFERDGRWSLVALSAYFAAATVADSLLWRFSLLSVATVELATLAVLPLLCFRSRSPRIQQIVVAVYVLLSLWSAASMSPHQYS